MRSAIYWIKGAWRGKLGVAARPRGGDWLTDEVAGWSREGVNMVVSLLTPDEEREFLLQEEGTSARAQGIEFLSVPVRDRQVPDSDSEIEAVVQQLETVLSAGKNVLVHCRQGIGRSGLLAAALLINRGRSPEAALQDVSEARGRTVPETLEQRHWVEQYASKFRIH